MKNVKQYDGSHPMVHHRSGDPARGEWEPKKDKREKRRGKKRRIQP